MNAHFRSWTAGLLAAIGIVILGSSLVTAQPAAEKVDPTANKASASQRRKSLNNLKQILLAIHNYHDAMGRLPSDIYSKDGKPLLSWRVAILPYLEQDNVYRQFKMDEPWDSEHNKKLLAHVPPQYRVGIEPKGSTETWYQAFAGPDTPLNPPLQNGQPRKLLIVAMRDGTSNTFAVTEAGPPVPWSKPADIPFDPKKKMKLTTPFSNGFHVAMMDGSAWALKPDIDADVLSRLIGMSDGEVTPGLDTLQVSMPADSPEEKAQLQHILAENAKLISQIEKQLKEHGDLLKAQNAKAATLDDAEQLSRRLKDLLQGLTNANRRLRGEPEPENPALRKPTAPGASATPTTPKP